MRPYFNRRNGTVTIGNSCPITDGAAAVLLMHRDTARELGLQPLGYLRSWNYAGLEPERMGLGPAYATPGALQRAGVHWSDIDLIEMNEAFAAQVLANVHAFESGVQRSGTGLGLAICKQLIELMGGHITLVSSPGCGASASTKTRWPRP